MRAAAADKNALYYGDNLDILRQLPDQFVDLVYIDPPFNSERNYNVIFADAAAEERAFQDTWSWSGAKKEFELIEAEPQRYAKLTDPLEAMRLLLGNQSSLYSYLIMMSVRIVEMHRVLKPTGSFYLHCDPKAGHYLKIVLDAVFGEENFRSEIVWRRSNAHNKLSRQYGPIHDLIFFYSKTNDFTFHPGRRPYPKSYIENRFKDKDAKGRFRMNELTGPGTRKGSSGLPWKGYDPTEKGRHWAIPASLREILPNDGEGMTSQEKLDALAASADGTIVFPAKAGMPTYKQYVGSGVPHQDIWAYQPGTEGSLFGTDEGIDKDVKWLEAGDEKLGFETQKPVGVLERIISTSSNKGDLVLDAFCGCGTTVIAAERLGRKWIGIDITFRSIDLIMGQLMNKFYGDSIQELRKAVQVFGVPMDVESARYLANHTDNDRVRKEFEKWACTVLGGVYNEVRGADGGVDGFIPYRGPDGKTHKCFISVKSGSVTVKDLRDFNSAIDALKGDMGIVFTIEPATGPMNAFANQLPPYKPKWGGAELAAFPKLQVITVEEHFNGKKPVVPMPLKVVRDVKQVVKEGPRQVRLKDADLSDADEDDA